MSKTIKYLLSKSQTHKTQSRQACTKLQFTVDGFTDITVYAGISTKAKESIPLALVDWSDASGNPVDAKVINLTTLARTAPEANTYTISALLAPAAGQYLIMEAGKISYYNLAAVKMVPVGNTY